jgi:sugar lactone lactonase YvrE
MTVRCMGDLRSRKLVSALAIVLLASGLIASRATAAQAYTISGTVTEQGTGLGLAETQVTVDESSNGQQVVTTSTGLDGSYSLSIPEGTYDIMFTPPLGSGYQSFAARGEAISANTTLDVTLVPAGSVTFSGVLRDAAGEALEGARIILSGASGTGEAQTSGAGAFSVTVPSGTYTWEVVGNREGAVSDGVVPSYFFFRGNSLSLTSSVNEELTLPLHTLTLRVVGPGGSPIPKTAVSGKQYFFGSLAANVTLGADLTATESEVFESETTNAEGRASLALPDWAPGYKAKIYLTPPVETQLPTTAFETEGLAENQTRLVAFGKSGTDVTPPEVKCATPAAGWHAEDVTVSCSASDSGTGLANPEDASFTLTTNVAAGEETATAYTNTRRVCDKADNCAEAGPIGPIKVDRKPPSITVTEPTEGALIAQGSSVTAQYSCADGGSGVASCEGSVSAGQPINTSTPGQYTLSVSSLDAVGNQQSRIVHYAVVATGCSELVQLCQVGLGDISPPGIAGLNIEPSSVNTASGARTVTFEVEATDNLSGVAGVEVNLSGNGRWFSAPAQLAQGASTLDGVWTATVTLPAGSPNGSYEVSVGEIDAVGNSHTYSATELGVKELPNSVDQTGEPGPPTSPPEVSEVSATPPSVSTCTEAQSVSVEVGASDPSGVNGVTVFLTGPPGSQQLSAPATWTSGSAQKGQWSANLSLPAYAQEGEWKLSVQVSDSAGDLLYLSSAQLKSRDSSHFASSIQQTCIGDVTPPEVKGVEISPPTVDTSGKAREVTVKVHASDNLSGVASVTATLTDGSQQVSAPATLESTGTRLDGTWVATLVLPQWSKHGVWQLSLSAADEVGNPMSLSFSQLAEKELPDSIEQTGPGDETPPEINSGSVEPNVIDTASHAVQVHVHLHASDEQSGTARVFVAFTSAHGQRVSGWATLSSGTPPAHVGDWTATLTFPQYSEQGGWELQVELWDAFGNHRTYDSSELAGLGLFELHVGPPPTVSSVSPNTGPQSGGTSVTITGTNLADAAAVEFGSTEAASFKVESETSITAVAPPGTAGMVDVTVTTAAGTSPSGAEDEFSYEPIATLSGQFGSFGASLGQFRYPTGVAVDAQGDVWVADAYNSRLQKLDQNGKYLGALDPVGSPEGRFGGPNAVAVDAKGHVWVADTDKSRVEEFNQYGVEVRHFGSYGTGLGQFEYPMGVAVDGKGNVWVVDPSGNRVQEFNENGEDPRKIGSVGFGSGQYVWPEGIAAAPNGSVWITDSWTSRVEEFNESGSYVRQFGSPGKGAGQLSLPYGVAVDTKGDVWVADAGNSRVDEFNESGQYLGEFGSEGTGSGQFEHPFGVAVAPGGNVWVADTFNSRVEHWTEIAAGE